MELRWRASKYSKACGNCAEVASGDGMMRVRDTKDRTGPVLRFTSGEWTRFLLGIKARR